MESAIKRVVRAERQSGQTVQCTGLDTIFQHFAVPLVFVFKETLNHRVLLDALPPTLAHYPLFAGQLQERDGKLQINCNDRGVPVAVEYRKETFDSWLEGLNNRYADRTVVAPLSPRASLRRGAALASVRITHFRHGGSCLAVSWLHTLGDFRTVKAFMQAWGNACSGHEIEAPLLVEDRPAFLETRIRGNGRGQPTLLRVRTGDIVHFAGSMLRDLLGAQAVMCHFTDDELRNMRAALQEQAGVRLSTNDALWGHLAAILDKIYPKTRTRYVGTVINWRQRLGLASGLLGNLTSNLLVPRRPDQTACSIASELRQSIDTFTEQQFDYLCNERFIAEQQRLKRAHMVLHEVHDPRRRALYLNSWQDAEMSDLEFAGVRPYVLAFVARAPRWTGVVTRGFENKGVIVRMSVPRDAAIGLRSEPMLHCYRSDDEPPTNGERVRWLV